MDLPHTEPNSEDQECFERFLNCRDRWEYFLKLDPSLAAELGECTSVCDLLTKKAFQLYHDRGYLHRLDNPAHMWFAPITLRCKEDGSNQIIELFRYLIDLGFTPPQQRPGSDLFACAITMLSVDLCMYLISIGVRPTNCAWTKMLDACSMCDVFLGGEGEAFVREMIPVFLENGVTPTDQNTPLTITGWDMDIARILFIHQTFGFPVPKWSYWVGIIIPDSKRHIDFAEQVYGVKVLPQHQKCISATDGRRGIFYRVVQAGRMY